MFDIHNLFVSYYGSISIMFMTLVSKQTKFRNGYHKYRKKYRVSQKVAYRKLSYRYFHKPKPKFVDVVNELRKEFGLDKRR